MLPSTLYIMSPMHLQNLKLLRPPASKEMHLQESTLFDLGITQNVAKYPLHHVTHAPVYFEQFRRCIYKRIHYLRERSGSVVECLTRDRRVAGSSLTGVTALWSLSKTHLS